jgi:hypothetical protein
MKVHITAGANKFSRPVPDTAGDLDALAVLLLMIKAAFQNDGVPVWMP